LPKKKKEKEWVEKMKRVQVKEGGTKGFGACFFNRIGKRMEREGC